MIHLIHASPRLAERFIDDDQDPLRYDTARSLLKILEAQEPAPDQRATWERLIEANRAVLA